ncbi:DUF6232 family protein [Halorhabdus sp. CUG00001]|uniref:DUF6232 family protein n=1 Tax=Halorhabdus sp. CUG00001 TaxID=2600297 RepID=UPI00131DB7CC|nr:DUF6232 family protein [Halorhabdus sp. CUG00001]
MSTDRTEKALRSFLGDDEQLRETWVVDGITRGLSLSVPTLGGSETLGMTDQRLLWLDEELETVALEQVRDLESTSMQPSGAGLLAGLGGLALVFGLLVTPILWLFVDVSAQVALSPIVIGAVLFAAGLAGSRLRDDSDDQPAQHYLQIRTSEATVQVFADDADVDDIRETIAATTEGTTTDGTTAEVDATEEQVSEETTTDEEVSEQT